MKQLIIAKIFSRKFLTMIAVEIGVIVAALGYNVDPQLLIEVAGGIAALYIIVQGVVDGTIAKNPPVFEEAPPECGFKGSRNSSSAEK